MRMESETSGYDVIRAARQQPYDPATALLTAYPSLGNDWKSKGAQSLLVKPVNTDELLRQLEALLITHQDHKMLAQKAAKKAPVPERESRTSRRRQNEPNKIPLEDLQIPTTSSRLLAAGVRCPLSGADAG